MEIDDKAKYLKDLYVESTKHSHYQRMPAFLEDVLKPTDLSKVHDRYDQQRLDYFAHKVDFKGSKLLDVGANTGYFTFESFERGVDEVVRYEGNHTHAEFLRCAADIYRKKVKVVEEYMDFRQRLSDGPFDIVLLLNVLHHVGDDFGDRSITIDQARNNIIENLNFFADQTKFMIVQIGFSWKTDYALPLFPNGSKAEVIEFFRNGIQGHWDEVAIGIAEVSQGITRYVDLHDGNVARDNSIGEFRNRPIFILRSKRC